MRECGAGWTPRELPGVPGSHRSPRSPYLLPQVPPVQGITLRPGSFAGPNVPGGQSPARVGCTTAGAGATTPRPPPSSTPALLPGREPGSRGVPSFPILSPGGRSGTAAAFPPGSALGVVFLRWHQLLGPERPLVRRPLSLRGDYLLAAALFSPGHGACVGCGSCAGKPQSPWSDRGMGPLPLPLPAPGLTPPAPGPARRLRLCRAGERARSEEQARQARPTVSCGRSQALGLPR